MNIEGYPQILLKRRPDVINNLTFNNTQQFFVEINATRYIEAKEYPLTILVDADFKGAISKKINKTATTTLFVHTINETQVVISLNNTQKIVDDLKSRGFTTFKAENLLLQARNAIKEGRYDKALLIINTIEELNENALLAFYSLKKI